MEYLITGIALAAPWVALAVNGKMFAGRRKAILAPASMVVVYATLLFGVHLVDARLESELNAFDLNGDGFFTREEMNPAQEAAMARFVNDTGRALAPITGALFSFVYVSVVFVLWVIGSRCRSLIKARRA